MRIFFKVCSAVALIFSILIFSMSVLASDALPDKFYISPGDELTINTPFRITAETGRPNRQSVQTAAMETGSVYEAELKMMGIIPLKSTKVEIRERQYVIPQGTPFGIKMYTNGVIVVGMSDVDGQNGPVNPAKLAGLKEGDIIISINGKPTNTNEDVADAFESSGGKTVDVLFKRGETEFKVPLSPVLSKVERRYKAGLWVRDSSAGIGTMTYYDPDSGAFGALGHAVCDVDTGEIMPLMTGTVVSATITGLYKGKSGNPGELCGIFHNETDLGTLCINGETGVYGQLSTPCDNSQILPAAFKQEIVEGPAQILCTIDGDKPCYYDVEVSKVYYNSDSVQKNMIVTITDETLLEKTGGIIQGMSGSPIIQNGMFIGAVTHVFVNNPAQGYGIFAENMLDTSNQLSQTTQTNAA